jgi:hypothetical protein
MAGFTLGLTFSLTFGLTFSFTFSFTFGLTLGFGFALGFGLTFRFTFGFGHGEYLVVSPVSGNIRGQRLESGSARHQHQGWRCISHSTGQAAQ